MEQKTVSRPQNPAAALLFDVAMAALELATSEAPLAQAPGGIFAEPGKWPRPHAQTPDGETPAFPPSLPKQLGLTEEDMNQVSRIIETCERELTASTREFINIMTEIALDENPRNAALYHLQDRVDLLIRAVAYRVMAHERRTHSEGDSDQA